MACFRCGGAVVGGVCTRCGAQSAPVTNGSPPEPDSTGSPGTPRTDPPAGEGASPPEPRRLRPLGIAALMVIVIGFLAATVGPALASRPSPTPTAAPAEIGTTTPAGEPTAAPADLLRRLPDGSWVVVLESLPQSEWTTTQAVDVAAGLARGGRAPFVIDSDLHAGLNSGYLVVVDGPFADRTAAGAACAPLGREVGGSCYPRQT